MARKERTGTNGRVRRALHGYKENGNQNWSLALDIIPEATPNEKLVPWMGSPSRYLHLAQWFHPRPIARTIPWRNDKSKS